MKFKNFEISKSVDTNDKEVVVKEISFGEEDDEVVLNWSTSE
jgi:hypothetical protein